MFTLSLSLVAQALLLLCLSPSTASLAYDPSTPLLLDAYLANETSQAEGRHLARVTSFPAVYSAASPTTQTTLPFALHSGFFSIAPSCSLFFQLFSPDAASEPGSFFPLIVFLAGGPGVAATYWSLYGGVTPLTYTDSPTPRLLYHNQSWAEDAHVLLIDSPISIGYSQCSSGTLHAANNSEATAQLVTFMRKFLTLYPSFSPQYMYIAGHSYGGRSAPDLAAALSADYNIAGVIVESGLTQTYLSFSETCNGVYQQGLFNHTERQQCNDALERLRQSLEASDESAARQNIYAALSMWISANGGNAYQDFERTFSMADADVMGAFLTSADMRLALHAGSNTPYTAYEGYSFTDGWSGESLTALDTVLSMDSGGGRVLYFASNKDSLLGYSTQRLLSASKYNQRSSWDQTRPVALQQRGSNTTRGLLKKDARLWFATLYDASHMLSIVQPMLVRQLVYDFTRAAAHNNQQPDRAVASSDKPLEQWEKLLPPINRQDRPSPPRELSAVDVSPAVYLTPYLSLADGPALAQQASAVTLPHSTVLAPNSTYSGYITIDADYNSNSFFWFLPSLDKNASAPLILHLSGGPGISSMAMGFLYQHGPFTVDFSSSDPLDTHYRPDNYNEHNHMLYVDNPIGTGFSYTDSPQGFRNDSRQIADDLYELLRQFFLLFPAYRTCRLYVHGVSYAGHFLPTLGWKIHNENVKRGEEEQIAFEGLLIASGWMDPMSQTSEEDEFFMSIGRMDLQHTDQLVGCTSSRDCDLDYYNYVWGDVWDYQEPAIMAYLSHPSVVSALHAGERGLAVRSSNNTVTRVLTRGDPSVKAEVEHLLASGHYQVVMYTAEYDVVCAASGVTNFIATLDYTRDTDWERAVSKVWWPQPARPEWQARQPPHTSPLQPWQPQPQGIWWSSSPHSTLHHAMIRFAGHLIEQTHLFQAGQIIARVQSWPTLPKPAGGGPEPDEKTGSGLGRAFIALIILSVIFGLGAFYNVRKENREKADATRYTGGSGSTGGALSTSLLGDEDRYSNSTL